MAKHFDKDHPSFFFTGTVVGWVDVFSREEYCKILKDSFNFCVKEKGLRIHAYVIMTNHFHMVASSEFLPMGNIVGSLKQFTAKKIFRTIEESDVESRKEWMLNVFRYSGKNPYKKQEFQFWKHDNEPIQLSDPESFSNTINYVHMNPVKACYVSNASDWLNSSAGDYSGLKGDVEIDFYDIVSLD